MIVAIADCKRSAEKLKSTRFTAEKLPRFSMQEKPGNPRNIVFAQFLHIAAVLPPFHQPSPNPTRREFQKLGRMPLPLVF